MNSQTALLSTVSCSNKRGVEHEMRCNALSDLLCEWLPALSAGASVKLKWLLYRASPERFVAHTANKPLHRIAVSRAINICYTVTSKQQKALACEVFAALDVFEMARAVPLKAEWEVVMGTS